MNIVRARGSSGRRSSASINPSLMKSGESNSALAVWTATPLNRCSASPSSGSCHADSQLAKLRQGPAPDVYRHPRVHRRSHRAGHSYERCRKPCCAWTPTNTSSLPTTFDDFSSFYFDTALSSSAAALSTLLAFARPGHITFGSDWPFAPVAAGKLFAAGRETYPGLDADTRRAIDRTNALALFPRLGTAPVVRRSRVEAGRHTASRVVMRGVARLIS